MRQLIPCAVCITSNPHVFLQTLNPGREDKILFKTEVAQAIISADKAVLIIGRRDRDAKQLAAEIIKVTWQAERLPSGRRGGGGWIGSTPCRIGGVLARPAPQLRRGAVNSLSRGHVTTVCSRTWLAGHGPGRSPHKWRRRGLSGAIGCPRGAPV
jgi:hypothetical protein